MTHGSFDNFIFTDYLKFSLYCFTVCVLNPNISHDLREHHLASLSKLIKNDTSNFIQALFAVDWKFPSCKVIWKNSV